MSPRRPFARLALASLAVVIASSCGRFDYERYPIDAVEVTSPGGTILPPGGSTTIELSALPGPFVPGTTIRLTFELGKIRAGESEAQTVILPVSQDGEMGAVTLVVPLDVAPGRILTLTSPARLLGDLEFEVREPDMVPAVAAGLDYEVLEGFEVDAPIPFDVALLAGRAEQLALPADGSAFGEDVLYVGLSRPPAVLRAGADGLEPFAQAPEPERAGDRLTAITFPLPDKGYGDNVYLCTSNDDGILALDASGAFVDPVMRMACSGLVFDHEMRLDYDVPFPSPLYFADPSGRVGRVDAAGSVEILGEGLPAVDGGLRLRICPKDYLEANTILLSTGAPGIGADGAVFDVDRLVPYREPQVWLEGLAEPEDAAFTRDAPYGWMMFLALAGSNEVVGVRRDGSMITLLSGVVEPAGLLLRGTELWILGRGRGELVRVRPAG